ncbi:class II histone deacetylase [Phaeobacter sp. HF9A]|uniref:class II histone deacetylase n=1 Tax=Phaeobacter sp. HF9A TaxID=2721561 RepID=UPI0014302EBF|nr:class II histone deacetylase [Phaeobacter sp. HF9A]NIZ13573.1 class II histone deacetylase [Phaeobacter sp. HF9A]
MRPAFYFDEKTLWFSAGQAVLVMPVGGWLQPPSGGGHADSPEPKRRLHSLMQASGLISAFDVMTAPEATTEHLARVHPQEYLDTFKSMSDAGGGALHFSAPFGPGSYEIAALSAGLVEAAVMDVATGKRKRSYAISRPSGHHCLPDQPLGFCLFANVALAALAAKEAGIGRIAIVDWDVHHGNGTEAIFWEDPDVLTISMHQEACFPPGASGQADARGGAGAEGSAVNIPLWPGCGHDAYIAAFEKIVAPALTEFAPDMIIVVNGLDANGVDPLARMVAHSETFRAMTKSVLALADSLCDGRIVFVQEGGYAESYVPFCALAVLETLAGVRSEVEDPFLELIEAQQPGREAVAAQLAAIDALAEARPPCPSAG